MWIKKEVLKGENMKKLLLMLLIGSAFAILQTFAADTTAVDEEDFVVVEEKVGDTEALQPPPTLKKEHYGAPMSVAKAATTLCEPFPAFIDTLAKLYNTKVLPKLNKSREAAGKKLFDKVDIKKTITDKVGETAYTMGLDTACTMVVMQLLPKVSVKNPRTGVVTKAIYPLDMCTGQMFTDMAEDSNIVKQLIGKGMSKIYGTSAMLTCASFMKNKKLVKPADTVEFTTDVMAKAEQE